MQPAKAITLNAAEIEFGVVRAWAGAGGRGKCKCKGKCKGKCKYKCGGPSTRSARSG